jgi:hypothetical protein
MERKQATEGREVDHCAIYAIALWDKLIIISCLHTPRRRRGACQYASDTYARVYASL